jgi:hypothetical protein
VIENDNLFATVEGFGTKRNYTALSKEEIRRYVKDAGIVGLGGTGFPTHVKLTPKKDDAVEYVIVNGMECDDLIPYNFSNKEDLKECIDMGMDAEDIAYLVNQYRDNKENTHFFYYINTNNSYTFHILTKQEVENAISKQIENIAYNVLRFPYRDVYGELYREFVVPMIDNQK